MDYVNQVFSLLKDEVNSDKYNEIIYEYCLKVNWDDLEIEKLGNLINKNVKQVRQLSLDYFNKVSNEEISDSYGYKNPVKWIIDYDPYINAYSICNAYNFNEAEIKKRFPYAEKELIYNPITISKLIEAGKEYKYILSQFKVKSSEEYKKVKKELLYSQNECLEVPNPALLKYGIKSYNISRTEEERKITLKYIYEKFVKSEGIVGNLILEFKLPVKQIVNYAYEYLRKYSNEENLILEESSKKKPGFFFVFQKLKTLETDEEIISLLDFCGIDIEYLRNQISNYLIGYEEPENQTEIKKMLQGKLKKYLSYLSQRKEEQRKEIKEFKVRQYEEENLKEATKYVSMFIEAKEFHSVKAFCSFINLDIKIFNSYVNIIKNRNQELYEKYKKKAERNVKQYFAIHATKVKKIVAMLKNGIEEDGVKRKFDILDYYQNTKLSFDNLTAIAVQICSKQELNLLKRFIRDNSKYAASVTHIEETIMKEKVEVNHQLDKNGMPIPGTGEMLDDESKIKIINYLKENNIPLNMKTYTLARRRYTNGTLIIKSKNKAKVLTKKNNEGENNE